MAVFVKGNSSGETVRRRLSAMVEEVNEAVDPAPKSEKVKEAMEEGTSEVKVTDRRRIRIDDEPAGEEQSTEELVVDPSETTAKDKLAEAELKRSEAERQVADLNDRFRKLQDQMRVESNELRLRLQRNFDQKLEAAKGEIVASLLDSLDNLKRAVAAAQRSDAWEGDALALLDGVRATADLFEGQMRALGLTPIESLGAIFDPEVHEAVESVPAEPEDHDRVVSELQVGYKFGDRLIRPARVKVGRSTAS